MAENRSSESEILALFIQKYSPILSGYGYYMHPCPYGHSKGIRVILHIYPFSKKKDDIKSVFPKEFMGYFIDVLE